MAHKALDIANAILALSDPEKGDIISNLKLQKLLYYTQGFSLAIHNKPMFEDTIKAWEYGPVVESVYHHFKAFGSGAIMPAEYFDNSFLSAEEDSLIKEVYEVYGQFSALKLMQMTHEESPWLNTHINCPISEKQMKSFFKEQIEE